MAQLTLHGSTVETVFDLLGHRENNMTFALGWGLSRSDAVLQALLARIAPGVSPGSPIVVELQEYEAADRGYTDVEISTPTIHALIEAKRGWKPPEEAQLRQYEDRLANEITRAARIVILTQNGAESIVRHQLADWRPLSPIEAHVLGWSDVFRIADNASHTGPLAERRLAAELASYLREVADMRDTKTNEVHVVALTRSVWDGWPADLSSVDEVEKYRLYHYPTVGHYRKTVPNYMGFRYDGRLQSIHHVNDYEIIDTPHGHVPGAPDLPWDAPHNLLHLGPPIRPDHKVATGKGIWSSGPAVVDIDLLLTSSTITGALALSRARHAG